jgi:NAD(P)-dependent dehydrogenase (short-subunit alcohol dehydrogenase family)
MDPKSQWTSESIPDLSSKVVIITGANSGLGLETARVLVKKNATVILACKTKLKFQETARLIAPNKNLSFISPLDLSDPDSIKGFVNVFKKSFDRLDILINNAGIMNVPFEKTSLGLESQFAVNHLGHYALCGQLLDLIIKTKKSRVVNVSSIVAAEASFDTSNVFSEINYDTKAAYRYSKLANLYFSRELDRKFKENKCDCISVCAHPGYAKSNLQRHSKGLLRKLHILYTTNRYGQSTRMGALSILRASTEQDLNGNEYFHPNSENQLTGIPIAGQYPKLAMDEKNALDLWNLSERITNIHYNFKL